MRLVDHYRWWWLPGAGGVIVVLVVLAVLTAPPATQVAQIHDATATEIALDDTSDGFANWRCTLRFRRGARPGPAWRVTAGPDDSGLVLAWDPDQLVLRLHLLGPNSLTGVVLGRVAVPNGYDRVTLSRRGQRVAVQIDDRTAIVTLSPERAEPERRWRLSAATSTGGATLSVTPLSAQTADAAAAAAAAVADALANPRDPGYRDTAEAALASLPTDDEDRARLTGWLQREDLRQTLRHPDADPTAITAQLVTLAGAPDGPVLLAGAIDGLVARGLATPADPSQATRQLAQRQAWLGLVAWIADRIGGGDGAEALADPVLAWQISLSGHTARVLAGLPTAPTPGTAPIWLTGRWRLLRGIPAIGGDGNARLAPLPDARWPGDPLRPALEALLGAAGLPEREASMRATIRVRHARAARRPDEALLAISALPDRERVVTRLLLALDGTLTNATGVLASVAPDASDHPVVQRDALAWALANLLRSRLDPTATGSAPVPGQDDDRVPQPPAALADQADLLAGTASAPGLVFGPTAGTLPPPQALLAALAMQEVAGLQPEWTLMTAIPDPSLPLDLAMPPAPAAPGANPP